MSSTSSASVSVSADFTVSASLVTEALAAHVTAYAKQKFEDILVRIVNAVAEECDIKKTKLGEIISRVAPECAADLNSAIEREQKRKEMEVKRLQKKMEEASGPHCQYVFGEKAKRAGEECGDACKDASPSEDGKVYCKKHSKQIGAKHSCCFVFGEKAKKAGQVCGSRVAKDSTPFELDGEYAEGVNYHGEWLCKRHTEQVAKSLTRKSQQCKHVFGEKSARSGEQCTSQAKGESEYCSKHQGGGKKEKSKKEAAEKRKKAKSDEVAESKENTKESKKDKKKDKKSKKDESSSSSGKSSGSKKKDESSSSSGKSSGSDKKKGNKDLTIKHNFTKRAGAKADFVVKSAINTENEKISFFVDRNSGLVCVNLSDPGATEIAMDELCMIGVWDNKTQTHGDLTEEACAYGTECLNLKLCPDEDEEAAEEAKEEAEEEAEEGEEEEEEGEEEEEEDN